GCSAAVAEAPELETSAATHARGRDYRDGPQPPESYERRRNAADTTLAGITPCRHPAARLRGDSGPPSEQEVYVDQRKGQRDKRADVGSNPASVRVRG
ncbi:unnamed protein product, partial [Ascophyllum nodosum]